MINTLTLQTLFEYLQKNIDLKWHAGRQHASRPIKNALHHNQQSVLVGYLNLIHPNKIQVVGKKEWLYLSKLKQQTNRSFCEIFSRGTVSIVFSDDQTIPDEIIELADKNMMPLFQTALKSGDFIDAIRFYLSDLLAEKTTLHGVFMEVMGSGVLITGESSIGKSELALELITRGHRLIADDAPTFTRIGPDLLNGHCPEVLQDFMEVRGLGVLDIRAMYGDNAIKPKKHLRLVIHLERMSLEAQQQLDRLYGSRSIRTILGVTVTEIKLPVASGRNLAVMVEAAVRNHILIEDGHNASDEFIKRQRRHMNIKSQH